MNVARICVLVMAGFAMSAGWCGSLITGLTSEAIAQSPEGRALGYKLPKFKTDRVRFCLLKLPAGTTESLDCLMAVEDSTLFIDLNFNKDLTEDSERFHAARRSDLDESKSVFKIPQIQAGTLTHRQFVLTTTPLSARNPHELRVKQVLAQDPFAQSYELQLELDFKRFRGIGVEGCVPVNVGYEDLDGILQFSSSPSDAPHIDLSGGFEIRPSALADLRPGSSAEVNLLVGTRGVGPGTFASFSYNGVVPEAAFPRLTLECRNKNDNGKILSNFDITQRC